MAAFIRADVLHQKIKKNKIKFRGISKCLWIFHGNGSSRGKTKKKEKMKEIRKKGPAGRPCKTCAGLDHGDTPVIPQPSPPLLIWVEREGRFTAALDFSLSFFLFLFPTWIPDDGALQPLDHVHYYTYKAAARYALYREMVYRWWAWRQSFFFLLPAFNFFLFYNHQCVVLCCYKDLFFSDYSFFLLFFFWLSFWLDNWWGKEKWRRVHWAAAGIIIICKVMCVCVSA